MSILYLVRDVPSLTAFDWEDLTSHCKALADPNLPTTLLAAFLVLGIVASYVPQHLKIYRRRSSEGLSPWWVLLGGLSSVAAIGNILVLPTSRADMRCCKDLSGGACAAALLGVAQIGCQWTCFMFIVLLYLAFYPYEALENDEDLSASITSLTKTRPTNSRRDPLIVGAAIFVACFAVAIVSLGLVFAYPHRTQVWADVLGTISGVLAAVQYLPQIHHTWVCKDIKSLSVMTLLMQAPGSFLFAFSLALRVGSEGWSTWLVYVVTGSLQFVLLALAITFGQRDRDAEPATPQSPSLAGVDGASERTPLLSSANTAVRRD